MIALRCPRSLALLSMLGLLSACGGEPRPATPAPVVQAPSAEAPKPIKIGVALGGGAAKGFAHIGVIKMLEANGFAPVVVSGTSAGSVVGALYASGMDAFQMQEKAVALDQTSIRDVRLFSGGLVQGQKLQDYVNEQLSGKPIEKLRKPFAAVATRLEDGERTVFVRGNAGQAVRASSSIPGVFEPVTIGKYHFVDGGVVSPVPVDAARQLGAEFVVAVDISSKASGQNPGDLLGTVNQSISIMGQRLGEAELKRADVVVRPKVNDIGSADFNQRGAAILEGERAAMAVMPQIRAKIAQLQAARSSATRTAADQAKAARQQAYERCLEQRSRWEKLRGKDEACVAP
ncbi:Patatin [Xanthomonas citri pv. fuscans CFBP 6996]|uniref:patatin-like phospholipase family protein n=1 Tax=Xanthomonas citri TaxID=346 RepID=UPI000C1A667F|nr:patatin-like phospholipase family protein [Xanthomonas citri]ATS49978.1 patatin-like phospholipase family protein [Xanthomonas citri pv. phaseoli var. fuscans]ATS55711.1 patatin-like phospholipase family protein [Xanthomonas citri pv. phaseoli var. fuscans]ATS60275.1 patatin-like phospholipase family protein [Xanthomonas citri pv. phaseoli var. fuscans]PTY30657.1 Patatin [Xanthomonas citri pv. fuscans CFBP 6996]QWN14594.1 Patatin [Xanthomonas citri]